MPPSTYKPLFNRRYLFWLIWAVAIAIVLLSTIGREKPRKPYAISWQADPAHWRMRIDVAEGYQLDALLSVPTAVGLKGRQLQATHYHAVKQRLSTPDSEAKLRQFGWQPMLTSETALIRLRLLMPEAPTKDQLDWLSGQLHSHYAPLSEADHLRLLAEWRLDMQQPEARLMAELESWQTLDMPDSPNWQVLLTGPELEPGQNEPVNTTSKATDEILPGASTYQLDSAIASQHQLLAWPVPAIVDANSLALNRTAVTALQSALNQQNTWQSYRLIWQPLPPQRHLVLILNEPLVTPTPAASELLVNELSDSLLQQAQEQLLEQLAERYNQPDFQRQWLELTALLALPIGSEAAYEAALKQLSPDAVRQQLRELLNIDQQLSVTLTPF